MTLGSEKRRLNLGHAPPLTRERGGGGGRREGITKAPLVKFLGIFKVNYTVLYAYLGYYEYIILTV